MRRIRSITPAALGIALVQSVPGLLGDPPSQPPAPEPVSVQTQSGNPPDPPRSIRPRATRARSSPPSPRPAATRGWKTTRASWYDVRPTACYDDRGRHEVPAHARWAAHRTLPCGTRIQIATQQHRLTLEIWDRGPYHPNRALDLSVSAFAALAPPEIGVIGVRWRVLAPPSAP